MVAFRRGRIRSRQIGLAWATALPIAIVGCGGGDSAETATGDQAGTPAAPSTPPGGETPPAQQTPPAHETPAAGHAASVAGNGTPMPGAPNAAHEGPATGTPMPGAPEQAPSETVAGAETLGAETPGAPAEGEGKSTGSWLAGMASAVFGGASAPPEGGMQPAGTAPAGGPADAHGAPAGGPYPPGSPEAEEMQQQEIAGGEMPSPGDPAGQLPGDAAAQPPGDPALAGEMPSPEGYEGVPGAAGGATQEVKETEPGTSEHAVQQLVLTLQKGEMEGLSEVISAKTGDKVLAPLRDGTADETQLAEAQKMVTGAKLIRSREAGTGEIFYVSNAEGQSLTITTRRNAESGKYEVTTVKVETPRTFRRNR